MSAADYIAMADSLRATAAEMQDDGIDLDVIANVLEGADAADRAAEALIGYRMGAAA